MASSVLFTGDSSMFVYHGQWLALLSLHMVALGSMVDKHIELPPVKRTELAIVHGRQGLE
jgi:hypothetical protein